MVMKVSLAEALGTCFGVQDAIDAALDDSFRDNLTIIGELVHNPQTLENLRLALHFRERIDPKLKVAMPRIDAALRASLGLQ